MTEEKLKRLKRFGQKQKELKLRKLYEEIRATWKAYSSALWVDLEVPIQNGYIKYFVLRDDVARRQDASIFHRILSVINNSVYCRNTLFKVTRKEQVKCKKQLRTFNKKVNVEKDIPHEPKIIGKGEWDKLGWPESYKKWFTYTHHTYTSPWGFTSTKEGWVFSYGHFLSTKIDKSYITRVRLLDPEVESKEKILWNRINRNNLWPKIIHMVSGSNDRNRDEWFQPKHVQLRISRPSQQKYDLNQEAKEELETRLYRAYVAERYGISDEPWDDPEYVFEESSS